MRWAHPPSTSNLALVGQRVSLRRRALDRTLVIAHAGAELKRVPIPSTGLPPVLMTSWSPSWWP